MPAPLRPRRELSPIGMQGDLKRARKDLGSTEPFLKSPTQREDLVTRVEDVLAGCNAIRERLDDDFCVRENHLREQIDSFFAEIRSLHALARDKCDSDLTEVIGQVSGHDASLSILEDEMKSFTRSISLFAQEVQK
jgi:hypothetical protein